MAGKKKAKVVSTERAQAQKQVDAAKSDQEKRVARQNMKMIKFREIGTQRLNKVISALRNLGKLANRNAYGWDAATADKINTALSAETSKIRAALAATGSEKVKEAGITL